MFRKRAFYRVNISSKTESVSGITDLGHGKGFLDV